MKRHRLSTRGLLMLLLCVFLGSVFALSAFAVYFDESCVKPKEGAVFATLVLNGPYSFGGEFIDKFNINVDTEKGVEDMRELESCVNNITLKEYTNMGVWEAEFTYKKADGTTEQRTYRKSDASKDVDKFLCKYYKP